MSSNLTGKGRLGSFGIPYDLLAGEKCWFWQVISKDIVIVQAVNLPDARIVEYIGLSNWFDKISGDEKIPWYKIEVDNTKREIRSVNQQQPMEQKEVMFKVNTFSVREEEILKNLFAGEK